MAAQIISGLDESDEEMSEAKVDAKLMLNDPITQPLNMLATEQTTQVCSIAINFKQTDQINPGCTQPLPDHHHQLHLDNHSLSPPSSLLSLSSPPPQHGCSLTSLLSPLPLSAAGTTSIVWPYFSASAYPWLMDCILPAGTLCYLADNSCMSSGP